MSDRHSHAAVAEKCPTAGSGDRDILDIIDQDRRTAEHEASLVSSRKLVYRRRPPLSRGEEIELARRIEEANRALVEALAGSPVALGELAVMAEGVRDGTLNGVGLTPAAADDGANCEQIAADILSAIQRVRAVGAHRRIGAGARERAEALDHFAETALRYGLSHTAIDRILGELALVRQTLRGRARSALDASFSAIDGNRRAAERAKRIFVEANIGLVMMIATKRTHSGLSLHDLVQEGCMGLMRAVDKFDHRRGVRFSTYAVWWIRHAVNRALSDQARTIRIPVHLLETQLKVVRTAQQFRQQRGREPTTTELSVETGLPSEKLRTISSIPKEPLSMDAPLGDDNEGRLGDFVTDLEAVETIDEISAAHVAHRLRHLLTTLPHRDAEVLRLRFGIDRPATLTLAEIGQRFSVSRERIRQIESEALATLRRAAADEELDAHLAS